MNIRFVPALLVTCGVLITSSQLMAQNGFPSPAEKRVYHACLYAHWIDGYCRFHSWGYFSASFADCIIANGGCECAMAEGGYWGPDIDQACAAVSHRRWR